MKNFLIPALFVFSTTAPALANTLNWQNNSAIQEGVIIEMLNPAGVFVEVARVQGQISTYTDDKTEGVYRLRAFLTADGKEVTSPPSNQGALLRGPLILVVQP